ncbi:MAG: cytochrome c maturation protein CcmE [Pseudomonadota bacterium]
MNTRSKKRFAFILVGVVTLGAVTMLVLNAFNSNLVFFYSPTQVSAGEVKGERTFRLGGLVEDGSFTREDDGLTNHFRVTDNAETVQVKYVGILPDLFREGQGVVTQGRLEDGVFVASEVLAKHDENYMPAEVAEALEKAEQSKATGI